MQNQRNKIAFRPHRNLIFSLRGDCEGAGDMGGDGEGDRAECLGAFDEKTQVGAKIYKSFVLRLKELLW